MTEIWILTSEYNDYDQHGEYFEEVFTSKPTAQQLVNAGVYPHAVNHVLIGGGRKDDEHHWFHLRKYERGA